MAIRKKRSKRGVLAKIRKIKMEETSTDTVNPVQPEEIRADLDVPTTETPTDAPLAETPVVEEANVPEVDTEEKKSPESENLPDVAPEPEAQPLDNTPKKNQVDPSFDCVPCEGEGLIKNSVFPEGKVCLDCGGTGKKNRGVE